MGKRLKIYKNFRLRWHCTAPSFTFPPPQTRPLLIRINVLTWSKLTTSFQYLCDPQSHFDHVNTLNWVCNLKFSNFCKVVVGFCGHRRYLFCEGFQESISYDFLVLLSVYRSMMVWDGFKHIFGVDSNCVFSKLRILLKQPSYMFLRCSISFVALLFLLKSQYRMISWFYCRGIVVWWYETASNVFLE